MEAQAQVVSPALSTSPPPQVQLQSQSAPLSTSASPQPSQTPSSTDLPATPASTSTSPTPSNEPLIKRPIIVGCTKQIFNGGKDLKLEVTSETTMADVILATQAKLKQLASIGTSLRAPKITMLVPDIKQTCTLDSKILELMSATNINVEVITEEEYQTLSYVEELRKNEITVKIDKADAQEPAKKRARIVHSVEAPVMNTDAQGRKTITNISCHKCKNRQPLLYICPKDHGHKV